MSFFTNKIVTHTDVQIRKFQTAQDINGLMVEEAVVFFALGFKPESVCNVAYNSYLLNGNPCSFIDTFPNDVRFLLTEKEVKQFCVGPLTYMECFACSIEEALKLITERNDKRISIDKYLLSLSTGMGVDKITDLQVSNKLMKHYIENYRDLCIEGDHATSDLPY